MRPPGLHPATLPNLPSRPRRPPSFRPAAAAQLPPSYRPSCQQHPPAELRKSEYQHVTSPSARHRQANKRGCRLFCSAPQPSFSSRVIAHRYPATAQRSLVKSKLPVATDRLAPSCIQLPLSYHPGTTQLPHSCSPVAADYRPDCAQSARPPRLHPIAAQLRPATAPQPPSCCPAATSYGPTAAQLPPSSLPDTAPGCPSTAPPRRTQSKGVAIAQRRPQTSSCFQGGRCCAESPPATALLPPGDRPATAQFCCQAVPNCKRYRRTAAE